MSDRTDAFQIDSLNVYKGGVIGLARCPGRCGLDAQGHLRRRSLDKDVAHDSQLGCGRGGFACHIE